MKDFSGKTRDLFESQFREWSLARDNYRQLDEVRVRKVSFNGFDIAVQYNPGRITSSAAKVDARSIEARPCFLCERNRPPEQRGIGFGGRYILLINPFPIFRRHLTIVSLSHTPQRISGNFPDMLDMAEALPGYVIFYNGPQCGASAPDHLHFQAGNRGFLPVEQDFSNPQLCTKEAAAGGTELWLWHNYGRGMMTLAGSDKEVIADIFSQFYERFAPGQPERPEPMLNILAYHTGEKWIVHIIPRKVHRPACYFAGGDEQILLSPASVDLGGVFITPREVDFQKITAADIAGILEEVCLDEAELKTLTENLI
ncbi:MAG: DUF4922 domain-containing protein [Bacteroidales bacterium]|nr:DUF4922 domain-containing protein [Bacteroidales bacterium]